MADKKTTALTELATVAGEDILAIVDDPSGTPVSKKITRTNLVAGLQAEPSEGAFVDGDKTKLDGIEAGADVTDTTNVTAAGALMDSEVTNLAQVKAFNSSDYATAAQGATADSAVQPASTDTLTNKTIDGDNNTITNIGASELESNFTKGTLGIVIDGAGSAITTGIKGYLRIPYNCTINSANLVADQSGSIVIDVWKDTYANFPPTDADSITASAQPTLSTAQKSQDATLTGWTTSLSEGDYLGFNVDSAATVTRVELALEVTKT